MSWTFLIKKIENSVVQINMFLLLLLAVVASAYPNCTCSVCDCNGPLSCPRSNVISTSQYLVRHSTCLGSCTVYVEALTRDGSPFDVITMDLENYNRWEAKKSYSASADLSAVDVTCFYQAASLHQNDVYVVLTCENMIQNCVIYNNITIITTSAVKAGLALYIIVILVAAPICCCACLVMVIWRACDDQKRKGKGTNITIIDVEGDKIVNNSHDDDDGDL